MGGQLCGLWGVSLGLDRVVGARARRSYEHLVGPSKLMAVVAVDQ